MRTKFYLLALAVTMTTCTFAQDKDKDAKKEGTSLSIGLEGGLPVGNFGKTSSFGIGGSLKAGFPIFDGGAVTVSAGYLTFSAKGSSSLTGFDANGNPTYGKGSSLNTIPLKAGLRFKIAEGFYGEPQLGVTIASTKVLTLNTTNLTFGTTSKSSSYFTYAAGIGYMINKMIDIGLRYEGFSQKVPSYTVDANGNLTTNSVSTTTGFVGIRIAYSFGL